ncbi:hypothetical protein V2J09_019825, partial [Rumex salicifolius]
GLFRFSEEAGEAIKPSLSSSSLCIYLSLFLLPVLLLLEQIMVVENRSMNSNLDRFLHYTTPVAPSQFLPKSQMRNLNRLWHPWDRENVEYFRLGDLWDCYDEWSAYGAGVPIHVNTTGETLVQYYVPYLSALQIFTSHPPHTFREETDSRDGEAKDSYSESLSDDSSKWDGCSSEDGSEQENLRQLNDKLGYLYCQYFELTTPYGRTPLMEKIRDLSQRYPCLMSLNSVDLSPASWMAVSWYPIYHIPMGPNIKDLNTCFLTYHTLSSSFQDMDIEDEIEGGVDLWRKRKEGDGIPLPAFGLATYKMQGNLWVEGRDQERIASFLGVADSWLKQLRVQHHDYNYFTGARRV